MNGNKEKLFVPFGNEYISVVLELGWGSVSTA